MSVRRATFGLARALAPGAEAAGLVGPDLFLRTWPHRHDADGFFAAAWVRRG